METTKLKYRIDFLEECLEYTEQLKQNLLSSAMGKLSFSFGKQITSSNALDVLRTVYETKASNESSAILRNAILEMVLTSKNKNTSALFYAVLNFCECFLSSYKSKNDEAIKKDIIELCRRSRRTNLNVVIDHIAKNSKNDITFKILKALIGNIGFNTSLIVNHIPQWKTQIKINSAFEFEGFMHESFTMMTKINKWESTDVDFLVIDGIIESVGEIHHILDLYSRNKKYICIVARGFQEEVIATLSTNFLRKTLRCIPVVIPSNLNTINTFKDVSIVSGADMISSLKGETISSIKPEQIGKVESISLSLNKMLINNQKRTGAVYRHTANLRKKCEGQEEDIRRLLEKRIISLSPSSAKIFIGKHTGEGSGLIKDRLNLAIDILNSSCKYGIINLEELPELSYQPLNKTVETLKDLGFKVCPAEGLIEGIKLSVATSQSIKNSGIFILMD